MVESLLNDFAHNIGEQDGWIVLWDDHKDKPRGERYAQAMLRTALWQICKANDVDFTGEPNAGRGPCDFKFSKGWVRRALTEVKPTNISKYWHGLTEQTPQYTRSEQIHCGFFLSVGFRDVDFTKDRQDAVKRRRRRSRTTSASRSRRSSSTPGRRSPPRRRRRRYPNRSQPSSR